MGTKRNPGTYDCYAAAHPDEPMFTLLGRDHSAALLIRLWAAMRSLPPDKLVVVALGVRNMTAAVNACFDPAVHSADPVAFALERHGAELEKVAEALRVAAACERWCVAIGRPTLPGRVKDGL